ncbi:MAG: hypothetical protein QM723_24500 [Myxococcaceae bacterium]
MALPAWAVGERITVSGPNDTQLKEVLCNSMECVSSAQARSNGYSAAVEAKTGKDGRIDIKVVGADGKVRTTQHVPLTDSGRLSETDLVSATTEIMAAIEDPDHKAKAEASKDSDEPKPAAKGKHAKAKKTPKAIRFALRGHASRG